MRGIGFGGFGCLARAVLSKGRVSMIGLSASLTICSKVEELLFPRHPFELLFYSFIKIFVHIF